MARAQSRTRPWVKEQFTAGGRQVALAGDRVMVGDLELRLTHPDRVLWPDDGLTKRDLVAYYLLASPHILPYIAGRPLSLQVYLRGVGGPSLFLKQKPPGAPAWVEEACLPARAGHEVCYVRADDTAAGAATLAWLANRNCIPLHIALAREETPEQPDWLAFDLDPAEGADFGQIVRIARWLHGRLDELRLRSFVKVSGSRGLHIVAPIVPKAAYDEVRAFTTAVAEECIAALPTDATLAWPIEERRGKIFLDIRRNTYGATLVAPYSVRPKPGAPVSVALSWPELDDPALSPSGWDMGRALARLQAVGDPLAPALVVRQSLPCKPRAKG